MAYTISFEILHVMAYLCTHESYTEFGINNIKFVVELKTGVWSLTECQNWWNDEIVQHIEFEQTWYNCQGFNFSKSFWHWKMVYEHPSNSCSNIHLLK